MKKIVTTSMVLVFAIFANAQSYLDSTNCLSFCVVDSTYTLCDTNFNPNFVLNIEPSNNNIWQKGKTTKFGNSNVRDTSCAIFTDSINPYPINNFSAFNFVLPNNPSSWQNTNYYLKFWHKFDTDSLLDGCWLEFSDDSGLTWYSIDSLNTSFPLLNCNLYTNNLFSTTGNYDTLLNGRKAWSGNSYGWRYTSLEINYIPGIRQSGFINAVRFVFKSDSINNNKKGWIIDDFLLGHVIFMGAVENTLLYNQLPIYPNPSVNGIFKISFPLNYVSGTIQVYNLNGQKIIDKKLSTELDLSQFNNGLYYYKAFFDNKIYSGVLNKNKE